MSGNIVQFEATRTFCSREFGGSCYIKGKGYTARAGDKWDALRAILPVWQKAVIFKTLKPIKFLDIEFAQGQESYCLPGDSFSDVVQMWVKNGAVELTGETGIITLDITPRGAGQVQGSGTIGRSN